MRQWLAIHKFMPSVSWTFSYKIFSQAPFLKLIKILDYLELRNYQRSLMDWLIGSDNGYYSSTSKLPSADAMCNSEMVQKEL